jgi:hypothetical protein
MAEPREEIDEPELEDEEAADAPIRAEAEGEAELGCTVEGGLVRL